MKKVTKNLVILLICIISVLLFENTCAYSFQKDNTEFFKNLIIRQEKLKMGGVVVCRPVALDVKVLDMIIDNNIKSFQDYIQWLKKNIEYKEDKGRDCWSSPEETLQRGYGDCEDYAFFNEVVLNLLGYQAKVLGMVGQGGAHAVCVFQEDDYYLWISNAELKRTKAKSMSEFANYLFAEYAYYCVISLDLKTKDWDILFKKSKTKYPDDTGNIASELPSISDYTPKK